MPEIKKYIAGQKVFCFARVLLCWPDKEPMCATVIKSVRGLRKAVLNFMNGWKGDLYLLEMEYGGRCFYSHYDMVDLVVAINLYANYAKRG